MDYQPIVFDENTDYEAAEELVRELYSEKIKDMYKCQCSLLESLSPVGLILIDLPFAKINYPSRYQADIQAAYKLLTAKSRF